MKTEIQKAIEKIVTNGRGYLAPAVNGPYSDNYISLYDHLATMGPRIHEFIESRNNSPQLIYFVEATLCEFTKPGACSYILEFDDEKIDEARKNLSQEEINLLGELYELHCNLEELECYKKGVYRYSEVKELKPEINKLVDRAFISNA